MYLSELKRRIVYGVFGTGAVVMAASGIGMAFPGKHVETPETEIASFNNSFINGNTSINNISIDNQTESSDMVNVIVPPTQAPEEQILVVKPSKKITNTETTAYDASANGWQEKDGLKYFYRNGEPIKGWMHLKDGVGRYCYFSDKDGHMLSNVLTPDGYYVGPDGIYIAPVTEQKDYFEWNKSRDLPEYMSGLVIAGKPAEFYMLCIAGEISGQVSDVAVGDKGRGYGIVAFDYRSALVPFMRFAYERDPELWSGFRQYINCRAGDDILVDNKNIENTFKNAMQKSFKYAVSDQLEYARMYFGDGLEQSLLDDGIDLAQRSTSVSAALFSVSINCGPQPKIWRQSLSNSMNDEEMIRKIYVVRNTTLASQSVGGVPKGTTTRYLYSEPQMALDMLYGYTTIDSNVNYGGGVEWHGNPFGDVVTTRESETTVEYETEEEPSEAETEYETEEETSVPETEPESSVQQMPEPETQFSVVTKKIHT